MSSRFVLTLAVAFGLTMGASAQSDQDGDATSAEWSVSSSRPASMESLATGRDDSETLAAPLLVVVDAADLATGRDGSEPVASRVLRPETGPLATGREGGDLGLEAIEVAAPTAVASSAANAATADVLTVVRPNPVRDRAAIAFTVAERAEVSVTVVDIQGRVVAVAFTGVSSPGTEQVVWFDAASVAPGTYLAVLSVDGALTSRTFQVVR